MEPPFIMKLMASSVSIATVAGSIIRRVLASGKLDIVDKGVNDLQTQADRSVQHCIVNSLSKKFPGIRVIGSLLDFRPTPTIIAKFWSYEFTLVDVNLVCVPSCLIWRRVYA